MDIFRTNIGEAVNNGKLAENNFLIQENGNIRPLGTIGKQIWQSFSQYEWVRKNLFGVDNTKLAQLLETPPASKESTHYVENLNYLVDKGQITTESQQKILRKITSVSSKVIQ
jgi:hypothetical protein